ncbi:MAG: hypothetical protein LBV43_11085 [Prevotella sp.]|jgi:hypothetical protein|nr:hypothetical protein [Prevotella sp.]
MKLSITIIITLFFCSLLSFSQNYDLSGLQGLQNSNGEVELEMSGYSISIIPYKGYLNNDGTIKSIKGLLNLNTVLAEYSEEKFGTENKIIESELPMGEKTKVKTNQACYIFKKADGELTILLFQTLNQRDIILEQEVSKAYLANGLSAYISKNWHTPSITMAGKTIGLDSNCQWRAPRNLDCDNGHIRWSEFSSFESANLDINNRIDANNALNGAILYEEDIEVMFINIPSWAHRIVYQTDNKPLIVYYVVQEVNGYYVSCVMTNSGLDQNDYYLTPLLQKVMSIPQLPDNAFKPVYKPEVQESGWDSEWDEDLSRAIFDVRLGSWVPVGALSKNFKAAPSVGIFFGGIIKQKFKLDLGVDLALPVSKNNFSFIDNNYAYETKTTLMVNIALRFHYIQEVAKNVYWKPYVGIGCNVLETDLEKEYWDEEESKWESITTLDLHGGVSIQHKKVGCFLEYHFLPYSMGGKVRKNFGNSALNMGLFFTF